MFFGYNTNGFAHHRLEDCIDILAELGYRGIAITADFHTIDPMSRNWRDRASRVRRHLRELRMRAVVETGARYILDPRRKHQPTLLDPDRHRSLERLHYLEACVELAVSLDEGIVSFWSGAGPADTPPKILMARLIEACQRLCDFAGDRHVRLAFEPEPGMFIDTLEKFGELAGKVNHPAFGLTIDIGHLQCNGELPIGDHLRNWRDKLWNIHLDDSKHGTHEHLMFGEGEVDFVEVVKTLEAIGYSRGIYVELSRHSHMAVEAATKSIEFLKPLIEQPSEVIKPPPPIDTPGGSSELDIS
jgi:L-ribulose-5-phosphate 3-epimerase